MNVEVTNLVIKVAKAPKVSEVATTEKLQFTLFEMPCCKHLLCWVQPRMPAYCPSCGASVMIQLRSGDCTLRTGVGWFRLVADR
jgi:hypothetical protein